MITINMGNLDNLFSISICSMIHMIVFYLGHSQPLLPAFQNPTARGSNHELSWILGCFKASSKSLYPF
jgi:hypothetical protein